MNLSDQNVNIKPLSVLIADDSHLDRKQILRCIKKSEKLSQFDCDQVKSAAETISKLYEKEYDCLLLDYNLPDGSAIDVITKIRTETKFLPIVVITGFNNQKVTIEVMKAGASDYLSKENVNSYSLERIVTNAIEKSQLKLNAYKNKQKALQNSKLASLGIMAGGIAHEINNPLAILAGQAEVYKILKSRDLITEEKVDGLFDQIEKTVKRMAHIVDGLKSFCSDLRNEEVSLVSTNEIIEKVYTFTAAKLESQKIPFEIINSCDSRVSCNSTQVAQVILNLINNSIDAISEQEKPWIRLEVSQFKNKVIISVIDSGPKIPKQVQDNLFTPFFSTKGVDKGTGLGLSISKGVLGTFGGSLEFDAQFKNTRFTVSLLAEEVVKQGRAA